MTVVELHHEATGGGARHNGATPLCYENRSAHGGATRMLEDDVGVLTDEAADVFAEAPPFLLVLGVLVGPKLVAGRLAVDHVLASHLVEQLGPLGGTHHADR